MCVFLEFMHLIQDRLPLHLAGFKSWTFVHNCIMTDPFDVSVPEHRESDFRDIP
ncbi:MAG: hypothetical protein RLZZ458_617 [Planctomycetota bacterium]